MGHMASYARSLGQLIRRGAGRLSRASPIGHDTTSSGTPALPNAAAAPQISDPYLDWLCWANAGMLWRANLVSFEHAIRHLNDDAPIVEIGSFCGLSANVLTYYKRLTGRRNRLFTCDPWKFPGAHAGQPLSKFCPVTHDEYREFVRESFLRNVGLFSRDDLPYAIETPSAKFFADWRRGVEVKDVFGRGVTLGGEIGFVYIDGDHAYEAAKLDFQMADEALAPGGFVLFDDCAFDDVARVVEEVKATDRYEVVIANPNFLFLKLRNLD